ncbi:hypothetical protein [Streptomyces sp. NPDC006527]|uniref:hypothetical protein n=1 Tax=Streptomyces sp. NPDC006527 TaxID=3364749 RepID=UPI0036AF460D
MLHGESRHGNDHHGQRQHVPAFEATTGLHPHGHPLSQGETGAIPPVSRGARGPRTADADADVIVPCNRRFTDVSRQSTDTGTRLAYLVRRLATPTRRLTSPAMQLTAFGTRRIRLGDLSPVPMLAPVALLLFGPVWTLAPAWPPVPARTPALIRMQVAVLVPSPGPAPGPTTPPRRPHPQLPPLSTPFAEEHLRPQAQFLGRGMTVPQPVPRRWPSVSDAPVGAGSPSGSAGRIRRT